MRGYRVAALTAVAALVLSACTNSTELIQVKETSATCDIPDKVVTVNYQVSLATGATGPTTYTFLTKQEGAQEVPLNKQTLKNPEEWAQEAARIEAPTTVIFRDAKGKVVEFKVDPATKKCPKPSGAV